MGKVKKVNWKEFNQTIANSKTIGCDAFVFMGSNTVKKNGVIFYHGTDFDMIVMITNLINGLDLKTPVIHALSKDSITTKKMTNKQMKDNGINPKTRTTAKTVKTKTKAKTRTRKIKTTKRKTSVPHKVIKAAVRKVTKKTKTRESRV